ncbi:MAG: DMT family transporter [Gammaproteobacteria bacterium]|nr:DMT family transporter [Gammaproteobacteria bacterium]
MERQHHPYRATAFMLTATVFFCLSDVLGKWLTATYPVVQITWMRSIFGAGALLLAAALTSNLRALKTRRPVWHASRSVASGIMVLGVFYGLKNIPLAEFVALTFSVPFFIALFSPWLLREQVAKQSWIAITLGFIGVLFVLRPTPDHFHLAHLTTLGMSLIISLMLISARYLSTTETGWSLNFYLPVAAIVLLGYPALVYWIDPGNLDWALFATLGVSQTIALGCYIEALRLARAAVIAPLDYLRMIWTIIVGYLIWQELPDPYTWTGIIIIVASGIYIVRHSYVNRTEHA